MKLKEWFSLVRKKISEMSPKAKMIILISLCVVLIAATVITSVVLLNNKDNGNNGGNNGNQNNGGNNNTNTNKTYTVTIVDGDNNPVKDAKVIFTDGSTFTQPVATDANGKASTQLPEGTISVMISTIPDGYEKPEKVSGPYHGVFASNSTELTIEVEKKASEKVEYTITVIDTNGDAVVGMEVQICPGGVCLAQNYFTNEDGEITVEIAPGNEVHLKLHDLAGYTLPEADGGYHAVIEADETEIVIEIIKN
jgi:hypothetical protein